jgi:hypothetical protein
VLEEDEVWLMLVEEEEEEEVLRNPVNSNSIWIADTHGCPEVRRVFISIKPR